MATLMSVRPPGLDRWPWRLGAASLILVGWVAIAAAASVEAISPDVNSEPGQTGLVVFFNRPIWVLRAPLHGRSPEERAHGANQSLISLTRRKPIPEVTVVPSPDGRVVQIGGDVAFAITQGDLDATRGQTLDQAAALVVQRLRSACAAKDEQRSVAHLLRAVGMSLVAALAMLVAIWGLRRFEGMLLPRLHRFKARIARRLEGSGIGAVTHATEKVDLPARLALWFLRLLVGYLCLTFCLRQFPYTSIWAETMGGRILAIVSGLVRAVVGWLPELLIIVIIIVAARILVAIIHSVFDDIEYGRLKVGWCDPLTAKPTSRILSSMLWVFAVVMAYPYLPGSDSDAFKGVSVMLGLLVSLGSSGLVGQLVGGLVLMYSRPLDPGDYVRVGEDEGVVEEIGFLSTRIKTPLREQVNIPNALLLSVACKNYSAFAAQEGVIASTTVTIGYSTPWRQVHAMLQEAARRTTGVAPSPAPFVRQAALSDCYVQYVLNVFLVSAHERLRVLSALHASIQDVFNEYGVQIMSPNYEGDPPEKVWVPKEKWFEAPALPPGQKAAPDAAPKASKATEEKGMRT